MSARFTRMDAGSRDEWSEVRDASRDHQASTPDRLLAMLRSCEHITQGFGVTQLHHMLMTATLAWKANASDEMILVSLFHDIGKTIHIANHDRIVAEILRPFVSDDAYQVVRTHQDFQSRYWARHFDGTPRDVDAYRNEPWFPIAERFSADWDQVAFDPAFAVKPIEEFEPLVRKMCGIRLF